MGCKRLFSKLSLCHNINRKERRWPTQKLFERNWILKGETQMYINTEMTRDGGHESKFYGINEMADLYELSPQTVKRRAKEGAIPKPISWKLYGEHTRKPLIWARKEVDASLQELGII